SGAIAHWRRGTVDWAMAGCMTGSGLIGAGLGNRLFVLLRSLGQIDLVIGLSYAILLGALGGMMLFESSRAIARSRAGGGARAKLHPHTWLHGLPLKVKFRKARLYISVFLPLGLGVVVGLMTAIMGVGGGFLAVPAMIYLMGMPTMLTVGTSLLQITATSAAVVYLQAVSTHAVDIVLALLLILGGVAGAQAGATFGQRLRGDYARFLLALTVLGVAGWVFYGLVATPQSLFTIEHSLPED
ncbi:MAG: sulfite exporter TauE/SafE family protein, partial [Rhodospirillales bacterium]